MTLQNYEGELLVRLARKAFNTALEFRNPQIPTELPNSLREKRGVFVRIGRSPDFQWNSETETLACLGYATSSRELIETTIDSAVACAVRIVRLPSFEISQLRNLLLEISVLTSPQLMMVASPAEYVKIIEPGVEGLIVEHGLATGLILPQVAAEKNYDEIALLGECCMKAGLPSDSWLKLSGIRIYRFQAEVFRETGPDGNAVKVTS
jgi:uncharacterized protein (TIGR00296 family)